MPFFKSRIALFLKQNMRGSVYMGMGSESGSRGMAWGRGGGGVGTFFSIEDGWR